MAREGGLVSPRSMDALRASARPQRCRKSNLIKATDGLSLLPPSGSATCLLTRLTGAPDTAGAPVSLRPPDSPHVHSSPSPGPHGCALLCRIRAVTQVPPLGPPQSPFRLPRQTCITPSSSFRILMTRSPFLCSVLPRGLSARCSHMIFRQPKRGSIIPPPAPQARDVNSECPAVRPELTPTPPVPARPAARRLAPSDPRGRPHLQPVPPSASPALLAPAAYSPSSFSS